MSEDCDHEIRRLDLFDPDAEPPAQALSAFGDAAKHGAPQCVKGESECRKCGETVWFIYDLRHVEVEP